MKNEKKALAKELFFQSNLTKTEIAAKLGVSRRSIHLWSREGDWERLRMSARHLPSILAEQCYYAIGHLTRSILSEARIGIPITHKEADALHKVALTINKLKNRNTVNESMEMFTFFLDGLKKKDPELADKLTPHIGAHVNERQDACISDFLLDGFDEYGYIPVSTKDLDEHNLDEKEDEKFAREFMNASSAPSPEHVPPSAGERAGGEAKST